MAVSAISYKLFYDALCGRRVNVCVVGMFLRAESDGRKF